MTPLELARAIYDRQRKSRHSRDAAMPAWSDLPLEARASKIRHAESLQRAYHRLQAREVPMDV